MTISELRAAAQAATPGPWTPCNTKGAMVVATSPDGEYVYTDQQSFENRAYIALASPDTVLALLDVVEAAQALIAAVEGCRAASEAAITQKGAAEAFEQGYDPLDAALVVMTATEDALRTALAPFAEPAGRNDL
jgi:hypothetical protein